ncbi:hypothetical protein PENTCL1PPCAC_19866, partial [Pristionchus entomophagus]
HPKTTSSYAWHLRSQHNSTLIMNDIYLICTCGIEARTYKSSLNHNGKCDGSQFSLQKVDKKVPSTPQCILCEIYPLSPRAYAAHLRIHHKTTLSAVWYSQALL